MSKVALVLGGTGNIGSATVRAFLQADCSKVVVTSRSQDKLDKLYDEVKSSMGSDKAAKIVGIEGHPVKEGGAKAMKDKVVEAVGDKIDYLVSSMGFAWFVEGALLTMKKETLQGVFETQFFSAFQSCQELMPLVINAGGSYVFVTGGGPDMYLGVGTGGVTVGGSAATALAKVIMKEHAAAGICCAEVSFQAGISPNPSAMPPTFTWLSSDDAGRALVSVATKKAAHVKTVIIRTQSDMSRAVANGIIDDAKSEG